MAGALENWWDKYAVTLKASKRNASQLEQRLDCVGGTRLCQVKPRRRGATAHSGPLSTNNGFAFRSDQWAEQGLPTLEQKTCRRPGPVANFYDGTLADQFRQSPAISCSHGAPIDPALIGIARPRVNQHNLQVFASAIDRSYLLLYRALQSTSNTSQADHTGPR